MELAAAYLRFARAYYGDGQRGTYATIKRAVRPLTELYGRTTVGEFGPRQFKAIRQTLIDADLSRGSIN